MKPLSIIFWYVRASSVSRFSCRCSTITTTCDLKTGLRNSLATCMTDICFIETQKTNCSILPWYYFFQELLTYGNNIEYFIDDNLKTDYGKLRNLINKHDNKQKISFLSFSPTTIIPRFRNWKTPQATPIFTSSTAICIPAHSPSGFLLKKSEVRLRSERSLMLKIYQCVCFAKRNKSKISKLILCFSRLALTLK